MSDIEYVLLIDGDNVNCSYMQSFCDFIQSKFGKISEIYLFGKLDSSYLDDWKAEIAKTSSMFTYKVPENHKNSTDIQMILVAFQKYFSEGVRHFVILSSDSDMISVVTGLPSNAEVIVGYSHLKASSKYLAELTSRNVKHFDIDAIRGSLSEEEIKSIVNKVLESYIGFKLSNKFFSYSALQEWVSTRYPELVSIDKDVIYKYCDDLILQFTRNGVHLKQIGGEDNS